MDTRESTHERISALADGEAGDAEIELAMAALRSEEGRERWAAYHRVGDLLRSEDLAAEPGADFMARFSARLEAEPTMIAPAALPAQADQAASAQAGVAGQGATVAALRQRVLLRRVAGSGLAVAAAIAAVAFLVPQQAPELDAGGTLVASAGAGVAQVQSQAQGSASVWPGAAPAPYASGSARQTAPVGASAMLASSAGGAPQQVRVVTDGRTEMLRDPVVDQLLMAHQRVSPSFYSAAQNARPLPVDVKANK